MSRRRGRYGAGGRPARGVLLCLLTAAALTACSGGDGGGNEARPASDASTVPTSEPASPPGTGSEQPGTSAPQSTSPGSSQEGSGDSSPDTPRGTPPSAVPSASASTPPTTAPKEGGTPRCTSAGMRLVLGRGDVGAGNIHYSLVFTNTSGRTCVLSGYPGVSHLAGDGAQIGAPAKREGGAGAGVRLAPGGKAHSEVHTLNGGVGGPCRAKGELLRVYPPGSREAMTTRAGNFRVCGDTFTVTTVSAGAGPS
ncbi:DUF4232 domain-containing protein [Streptomyces sp. SID11385]|uniref:DUF4232 domain-containing protein n=1 Tax=Streptomyces sp. SID11385 TaxID=2706031 RepID=UPI001EF2996C|nr:DUF4232 domain-containing protein [Streptomyces sp. SID11385]